MIRIMRIFVIIYSILITYDNALALPMIIRTTDNNNKPIPNITVATTNLVNNLQTTSNKNGMASFADKCVSFKNSYKAQNNQGVRICAYSSDGYYAKSCKIITNKSNCDETITLKVSPAPAGKKYPSAAQMKSLALSRTGNLILYPVCDSDYTNYPSNVTKHCVNNFFASTQVQMLEGEQLAKMYAKKKYNQDVICGITYRTKYNDDYIKCTSTDATHVYEFRFDDLVESIDDTIKQDTANAICRLSAGTYNERYTYCQKDSATEKICPKINTDANAFGWSAKYYKSKTVYTHTTTLGNGRQVTQDTIENNICQFDFGNKFNVNDIRSDKDKLLNPFIFEHLQVKSHRDIILLLNQHVKSKIGSKFKSLTCNKGFTTLYRDNNIHKDDVITCHLTTTDNNVQDVDFVFDDVNELSDTKSAGGLAGMSCISNDGQFDGRNCIGIGKSQCTALNYKLKGGTVFDDKLGICKLKDAAAADNLEQLENGLKVGGTIVAGILLTAATGGAGTAAVFALTTTTIGSLATATSKGLKDIQNEYARDFIIAAEQCAYSQNCQKGSCTEYCPNAKCAKDTLITGYSTIKNILTQTPTDQLTSAVASAHDTLLEKISATCVDKKFVNDLNNTTNTLGLAIEIADWTSLGTDILSLKNISSGSTKLLLKLGTSAKGVKAFSLGVRNAKALKTLQKIAETNNIKNVITDIKNKAN
ncbi:MAG: hypothetical protein KBT14_03815 [Proteobacteria bacterium]|nr:hypothetical protein [Candidatus Enterousia onthequi]